MRTSYPGRWLVIVGLVVWGLSVLCVGAFLAEMSLSSDIDCEMPPGSSRFGEATLSWFPPGTVCTYEFGEYLPYVSGPSPLRLVVILAALIGFPLLRYLSRLLKRSTLDDAETTRAS